MRASHPSAGPAQGIRQSGLAEQHKVLNSGCAASVLLAVAVDAFFAEDVDRSRLLFQLSVSLAAMGNVGLTSLGTPDSCETKLLHKCLERAHVWATHRTSLHESL